MLRQHRSKTRAWSQLFKRILPATSANLGPAFDAAALALSMFLRVSASPAKQFSVNAHGRDAHICGQRENHLILTTYCEVLAAERKPCPALALRIHNEIPIGRGCGSSAAARLAGIALANHFGQLGWTDNRIIAEAARRERHPDNVAACWLGGLAIARASQNAEAQIARIVPRGKWPLLLAVPPESLPTEQARRVLPQQCSRADAVANIQNSMLLMAAFTQGRRDLLSAVLEDHIHQPYRAHLCPLLPALQELSGTSGILGVVLSGAGPSVLMFLDSHPSLDRIRTRVRQHLCAHGLAAELLPTEITTRGASQRVR